MNNFNNMIKQAQELQQKMSDAQQKVETLEAEGVAGGGIVKVTTKNGKLELEIKSHEKIKISSKRPPLLPAN